MLVGQEFFAEAVAERCALVEHGGDDGDAAQPRGRESHGGFVLDGCAERLREGDAVAAQLGRVVAEIVLPAPAARGDDDASC